MLRKRDTHSLCLVLTASLYGGNKEGRIMLFSFVPKYLSFISYPLSICTRFLQFSFLKYWVWWTGFLVYFKHSGLRKWGTVQKSFNNKIHYIHNNQITMILYLNYKNKKTVFSIKKCFQMYAKGRKNAHKSFQGFNCKSKILFWENTKLV